MKKTILSLFIVLLLFGNLLTLSALTARMGNSRMILYPEVNGRDYTEINKTILIQNVNDIPINVTLFLEETSKSFIELVNESLILLPGEEYKAQFVVKVKEEGKYEGKINVLFSSSEEIKTETSVALSSTVIVFAERSEDYGLKVYFPYMIAIVILLLIVSALLIFKNKKRSVKRGRKINNGNKE